MTTTESAIAPLVTPGDDGEPTTTSLVIADGTGNQHQNVRELIEDNRADFEEFGVLRFETGKPSPHGGRPVRYAVLNEAQATLLMTYLRNSEVVRVFKKRLVHAFYALRDSRQVDMSDPLAVIEAESARVARAVEIARDERARADKAEKRLDAEQQHRRAIEGGDGIDPTTFGKKYFSEVPARKFDAHLYEHGYLINQKNSRVRADGSVRNGFDHRKPTAKGRKYFYAHDTGNYGGRRRFVARIRPQMEIALRDQLAAEGLPVNEHSTGLVLLTADDMRELGS